MTVPKKGSRTNPPTGDALPESLEDQVNALRIKTGENERALDNLLDEFDCEHLFRTILAKCIVLRGLGKQEAEIGAFPAFIEYAAFRLFPRFGLSNERDTARATTARKQLQERHDFGGLLECLSKSELPGHSSSLQIALESNERFVRGEDYACNTKKRIVEILGHFDNWFATRVGIRATRVLELVTAIEMAIEQNARAHIQGIRALRIELANAAPDDPASGRQYSGQDLPNTYQIECNSKFQELLLEIAASLPVSLNDLRQQDSSVNPSEWEKLIDLIGTTAVRSRSYECSTEVRKRPLFCFSADLIATVEQSTLLESIFDALEQRLKTDNIDKYNRHLKFWTEVETANYFRRVFDSSEVFTNVVYPDPSLPKHEAELDIAVCWPPFLFLVEIKSTQFRDTSKAGDVVKLKRDLKGAVEEPLLQAHRALAYISKTPSPVLRESEGGRLLSVQELGITKVFLIAVTFRNFRDLLTHLPELTQVGLREELRTCWAVSMTDLDIITTFLKEPSSFVHYVAQRINLQNLGPSIDAGEVDIFMSYLHNRLDPAELPLLLPNGGGQPERIFFPPDSGPIDEWFAIHQGVAGGKKPDVSIRLTPIVSGALKLLSSYADVESRSLSFRLLDLPFSLTEELEREFLKYSRRKRPPQLGSVMIENESGVIVLMIAHGPSLEFSSRSFERRLKIEWYRRKGGRVFGFLVNSYGGLCRVWAVKLFEGLWKFDEETEALLHGDQVQPIAGQKILNVYIPCPCGSGEKFKFCCMKKRRQD